MATLTINTEKILENIDKLNKYLAGNNIQWTLVTKMLCGHKGALEKILPHKFIKNLHSVGDSRITNLRIIKEIKPDIVTMYIKPPALNQVKNIIKYADISLNSSYKTIEALDKEAGQQGKKHSIIVMIEMGELREGIVRDEILDFYEKVFKLQSIETIGLGTNLGCMYGVEPTYDKLIQLSLYTHLIEERFNRKLKLISGGSSITLPLITKGKVPKGVNHFRVGEAAMLGVSPLNNKKFRNLSTSTIEFSAEILEINKKDTHPDGIISDANVGHTADIEFDKGINETYRSIVDFGQLDVDVKNLRPKDEKIQFIGTTSDMTVYDLGMHKGKYKVGEQIHFTPNYVSIARLMNSRYMTKKIF
jgi:predicted amino acid racemase